MKKILLFLLLSLFLFISCNKDDSNLVNPTNPPVPTLSSPINGSTNQSTLPTLNWNASSGATSYTLQVSVSNTFTSYVFNQSGLTSTNQQVSGLSNSTTYYWRVSATNGVGTSAWSNSSSPWNFTTIGSALPAPTLSSPANHATSVSISPALIWNISTGATSYIFQVSTSSSFGSFVYNQSGVTGTSQQVTGLSNNTKYYWRVSATNSVDTSAWSNSSSPWNFTTVSGGGGVPCPGVPTVTYGGKTYTTVQIGNQCWLKENLDVGTRINGSENPGNNDTIEKYCYDNNPANCNTYGGLYQWNEAMLYSLTEGSQGICPTGWHIPTNAEFEALRAAVNGDGNALKEIGQGTGTNTSGFSALLVGCRTTNGYLDYLGIDATFWSSTEYSSNRTNYLYLYYYGSYTNLGNDYKEYGFSVRCVKN